MISVTIVMKWSSSRKSNTPAYLEGHESNTNTKVCLHAQPLWTDCKKFADLALSEEQILNGMNIFKWHFISVI